MSSSSDYSYNTHQKRTFHAADYGVFAATLLASAGIGLYYAIKDRHNNTADEFLLGGRRMHVIPVALSLLSSFISAITLLGTPAEVYTYNTMYWWISVGFVITGIGSAHIFIPVFYRLGIMSNFEYLEMRFGRLVRMISTVIYMAWMLLYMSIVLYGPSLALNAVTGLSLWGSVVAVGLVCVFYTMLGGMKAVLWADSLQILIIVAGILCIVIEGCRVMGGIDEVWNIANDNGRILFFEWDTDPSNRHTTWNVVVGGGIFWCAIYGVNQAQVQRAISVSSAKKAQLAIWLNLPGMAFLLTIVCLAGVVMYSFYSKCDPVSYGLIHSGDQLLPLFAMDILGHMHGVPGLILSCVFSGSLSTISSGLNALAAVVLQDYVKTFCYPNIKPFAATILSKSMIVVCGLISLGLAFVVSQLGAILQVAYILFGILGGPLLGIFTLGMLFPWANKWGAAAGEVSALTLLLWIGLGTKLNKVVVTPKSPVVTTGCNWTAVDGATSLVSNVMQTLTTVAPVTETEPPEYLIYRMSYIWYTSLAVLTTVVVGLLVSLITGYTRPSTVDPALVCPFFDTFFPFLPESILKPLRFGVRPLKESMLLNVPTSKQQLATSNDGVDNDGIENPVMDQNLSVDTKDDGPVKFSLDGVSKASSSTGSFNNGKQVEEPPIYTVFCTTV
ncbi:hypothetical protein ScPMuIL_003834 [Solemya velum]